MTNQVKLIQEKKYISHKNVSNHYLSLNYDYNQTFVVMVNYVK